MTFRKATCADVAQVARLYEEIHTQEEQGLAVIGWVRGVYPTQATAQAALVRGDLFVGDANGLVVSSAIINRLQVPAYASANWQFQAPDEQVMVLHTLVVSPCASGHGRGTQFVHFYEQYAKENGCTVLRMDTNERNLRARALYQRLGYREVGVVPCVFNGIEGVGLVLLEKHL